MLGRLVGFVVRDVLITPEEIQGLMENRLYTTSPPAGSTRLTDWMTKHADELGARYSSELARRRDRSSSYEALREN
jgi:NADH dehydrogenase